MLRSIKIKRQDQQSCRFVVNTLLFLQLLMVLLGGLLNGCTDPPPLPQEPVSEVYSHPSMSVQWVAPPGVKVDTVKTPGLGWTFSLASNKAYGSLILGPTRGDFFFGTTRPTLEALKLQANLDLATMRESLMRMDELIASELTLINVMSETGLTLERAPTLIRMLDLQLPSLIATDPAVFIGVLTRLLHGETATTDQLTGELKLNRFRVLYFIGPAINAAGLWIQVKNTPAMIRGLVLVPANEEEPLAWISGQIYDHFRSAFYGGDTLIFGAEKFSWVVPQQDLNWGIVLDIDSSSSIQAGEFNNFKTAALNMIDQLGEASIETRLGLVAGCDGTFVRSIASAPNFAMTYLSSRTFLEERAELLLSDQQCRISGFQGLLGLDRQVHNPPIELDGVNRRLFVLFTDGDDHSHPLGGQQSVFEELTSHYAAELTGENNWDVILIAPAARCLYDDFGAIEIAGRIQDLANASTAWFIDACDRTWPDQLRDRIAFLTDTGSPYRFPVPPLKWTLSLRLQGKAVAEDKEKGWHYRFDTGSIDFGPLVALPPGAKIDGDGYFIKYKIK